MTPPDYICCGAAWPMLPVQRYVMWSKYNHALFPDTKLIIFHDGPNPNLWSDTSVNVEYLEPHLGRPSHLDHAGFFRSFYRLSDYLAKSRKVIWIEWDFCIVSQRFLDWICGIESGWSTVWCPQFNFPDSALQVICHDQYDYFKTFCQSWNKAPKTDEIEKHIPFTEVNHSFIGGRYADVSEKPPAKVDFVSQATSEMTKQYYDSLTQT